MKKELLTVFFTVLVLSGCGTQSQPDNSPAQQQNAVLKIEADRELYTPAMSSTVGIGLTPTAAKPDTKYNWKTNYGHFVSWGEPDFKPGGNGKEVTTTGNQKIYWSYDASETANTKPEVEVTVTSDNSETAVIKFEWDGDIVRVKN